MKRKTSPQALAAALSAWTVASACAVVAPVAQAQSLNADVPSVLQADNPCGPSNPCGPGKKKKKKDGSGNPCGPSNPCGPRK